MVKAEVAWGGAKIIYWESATFWQPASPAFSIIAPLLHLLD
jgi:hypothetical protein